ncbi:SBBP repeat-containing protein [Ottowia sp.]|uniref:SBBP repeat-containing protein n=1 Tax=Ottowia sp. TaxID=1898956 RepID=UPI003A885101
MTSIYPKSLIPTQFLYATWRTFRRSALLVTILSASLLAACGGDGGGSDDSPVSPSTWTGTRQLGAAGSEVEARGVATDTSGNVFVTGYTFGGLDGNTLAGLSDMFLTKYDSVGNKLYTRQIGIPNARTEALGVATDASGNVVIAGYTSGNLSDTLMGGYDLFLVKTDNAGNTLYTQQMGAAGAETIAYDVAIDANGNAFVAGYTKGGLDGNALTGTSDLFLTKYDSLGNKLYTRQIGVAGADALARGVAIDTSGNVFVVGYTTGGLDGHVLTGTSDLFVIKFDNAGNKIYTRQMGVTQAITEAHSVATDASGNVFITGYTEGGLDGNARTGTSDLFVIKFDNTGNKLFVHQMGAADTLTYAYDAAIDTNGNVFVTGETYGSLDGNARVGTSDMFMTKFDNVGNKLFTRQMGAANARTYAYAAATDASANVFVTGDTYGNLDGNTLAASIGGSDLFVTKFDNTGNKQ